MRQTLEARECATTVLAISSKKQIYTPDKIVELVAKNYRMTLEDGVYATPRLGYLKSNLKGFYYVILCDRCNNRCRKANVKVFNTDSTKVIKFLCGKCACVKYERKKIYEKRALQYLMHPEKIGINFNNLSTKHSIAILEASFMEERIRERANKNVLKYAGL